VLEAAEALLAEHAELERRLADPQVHTDQSLARRLARRYAELTPVVAARAAWLAAQADVQTAKELGQVDPSFTDELPALEATLDEAAEHLRRLLVPRDPDDDRDVILEIKAGEGGEESALFAGDLLRMYLRFAERQGWSTELLDSTESDLGGYKDVSVAVKSRGTPEPGHGVWSRLKYEGGVHRVQRVPVTESQGRIHTSAAGVHVLPEAEDVEVEVDPNDLRIDVFRSSGPGGQSVNTTDSAVRITHKPTGLVVAMQDEKSQIQNRAKAMQVLRSRLLKLKQDEQAAELSDARKGQVGGGGRSEKIRTYNFKENRLTDHRIGLTLYKLDKVLAGELDDVIDALVAAEQTARLSATE
jgi:peptide chain release factor 1